MDDLLLAITLEAEDYGITDPETIQHIKDEFANGNITSIQEYLELFPDEDSNGTEDFYEEEHFNQNIRYYPVPIPMQNLFNSVMTLDTGMPMNYGNFIDLLNSMMIATSSSILNANNNLQDVKLTLTKDALDSIKDVTYDELQNVDPEDKCVICFGKLIENKDEYKYNVMPCNHIFHNTCIKEYLTNYEYHCPICKKECGDHIANL